MPPYDKYDFSTLASPFNATFSYNYDYKNSFTNYGAVCGNVGQNPTAPTSIDYRGDQETRGIFRFKTPKK